MKFHHLLITGLPPVAVIGAIAYFNPTILTWPMVAILSVVFGVVGALTSRYIDPR